jgi:hypothetical protein
VRKLRVILFVSSLSKESFKSRMSKYGMYLELSVVLPDIYYNKGRLAQTFAGKKGNKIDTSKQIYYNYI